MPDFVLWDFGGVLSGLKRRFPLRAFIIRLLFMVK
jgi:hypothetical protein